MRIVSLIALVSLASCVDIKIGEGYAECRDAEDTYMRARMRDMELLALTRCERDEECALWQPVVECDGEQILRDCQLAVRVGNAEAAAARHAVHVAAFCEQAGDCTYGVLCGPSHARCVDQQCVAWPGPGP